MGQFEGSPMRRLQAFALLSALVLSVPAFAQTNTIVNYRGSTGTPTPVSPGAPLPITGSFSASSFAPGGAYATLTATGSSADAALPAGTSVIAFNTGTTAVSCSLSVGAGTAVASQNIIQASSWLGFAVGSNTHIACIDQTGSASNLVVVSGGTGSPSGAGGGGSGGGGAVTIADGADVTKGAIADAAATAGSTGTISAKLRLMTTQLDTIHTDLGANVTNPNSPAAWGLGATGVAFPANAQATGCIGLNVEQTAVTSGQLTALGCTLGGKVTNLPYSVKELMVRGSADSTDTAAHTILAAGSGSNKTYVTDWECSNTSASTVTVTFNDSASTKIIIPAGGGNNKSMHIPIVTAAATAFQYTASSGVSTLTCNAQGYYGL